MTCQIKKTMEKKYINYDEIILSEIEHINFNGFDLKEFNDNFLKNSVFELEVKETKTKLREMLKAKDNVKPVFLLIFANRLVNIANKNIVLKSGKHLEENIFLPELELLTYLLKEGNIIKDCCEYFNISDLHGQSNLFYTEILNVIIKIPALAINSILALKPTLRNNMDIKILDKYIPIELHDSNYYKYLWLCVLYILNGIKPEEKTCNILQVIFNRLFLRGYKDILSKVIIEWSIIINKPIFKDFGTLNSGKICLNHVFNNLLQVNKRDKNLIKSFIKQIFKEIETSRLQVNDGLVILNLRDKNFDGELKTEDIINDDFFLLFKTIIDFCVLEEDLSENKGFLKNEIFLIRKQSYSIKTYLVILDVCVLNIVSEEEFRNCVSQEHHFDYLERIKLKELTVIEESSKSKVYLNFFKELIQCLAKQWNSYQESMTYSLTLSTVIIRAISILIYLNLKDYSSLKKVLLEFYMDITEGIHFRLKNIDPVIRSSAMYLGEFYFNLLYELFPSTNEAESGYLMSEIPKFDELKLITLEIKNHMACIYNSTKFFIIKVFSDLYEFQMKNVAKSTEEMTLSQGEKESIENKGKQIVDEDDEFWNKAPSIKVTPKNEKIIQLKASKNLLSTSDIIQRERESKNKLVNKSFDLINFYTDERKSKEIPDKTEKLLNVLRELSEDIEKDDSNYDHLIPPLIDKLISLKEKDQKMLTLIIFSKLIQYKADKVAVNMITYSCNMKNGIPMDTKIFVLNSLISACQNMANSQSDTQSTTSSNKKIIVNLFDKHSLIWSSHLAKYIMNIIIQSENQNQFEKIPNIFFITSLELFNQIILNTSSNNTNIEQIAYSGIELVISIDLMNNHLFKDLAVRKSVYLLTLNIILKCKYSSYCATLNQILQKTLIWLSKAEISETDLNSIQIIQQAKSHMSHV